MLPVYAFNAENGDTTLTSNRIDACFLDGATVITDPNVDVFDFTVNVDTTAAPPAPCGAFIVC